MEGRLGGESEDAQGFTAEKADGIMSDLRGHGLMVANGVCDCAAGPMWRAGREGEEAGISVLTEDYVTSGQQCSFLVP